MHRKNGRNSDGTWAAGNAGKPKGARNKATTAALSLLEGEAEALSRKAVEIALEGDTTALRLCLERIAPAKKDGPVEFDLPSMTSAQDTAAAAGSVLTAVSEGTLTPAEGTQVMGLVDTYRRTLELTELEARIRILEEANAA